MGVLLTTIVLVFVLFAASRAILRYFDKQISILEMLLWLIMWSIVLIILIFPELTNFGAKLLGIDRGIDIMVYSGILLLFYLIFRLYVKIDNQEQEITLLTRELALRDKKDKLLEHKTKECKNKDKEIRQGR